jgi:hypothetical protein
MGFWRELYYGRADMSRWWLIKLNIRHHAFGIIRAQSLRKKWDRLWRLN